MSEHDNPRQEAWFQHALKRAPWRQQSQTTAIASLILIVAIIIGALYLAQATSIATTGRQLEDMQAAILRLQQQNELISADIALYRSLPRLFARASDLGFIMADNEQIEYLNVEGYSPNRPETVAPLETEMLPDVPEYDETFGGWLQKQWDTLVQQFEQWTSSDDVPQTEPLP